MSALREPAPSRIDLKAFGRRIRLARLDLGLSQNALGAALGVHGSQVSLTERGVRDVSLTELGDLSVILKRPIGWLLATDDPFGQTSVSDPFLKRRASAQALHPSGLFVMVGSSGDFRPDSSRAIPSGRHLRSVGSG